MRTGTTGRESARNRNIARNVAASLAVAGSLIFATAGIAAPLPAESAQDSIVGAWEAQSYLLSTGEEHSLAGKIFFTDTDWQVVFFVLDTEGTARRGSAEGGAYTTAGESLTFMHRFNLSIGEALPGLPADDLRMVVHESMTTEAARFAVESDILTLVFPSGNEMRFRRTS